MRRVSSISAILTVLTIATVSQSRENATQPAHVEIHRLIEELVSRFPPEYKDGEHQLFGIGDGSPPETPREKDASRVWAARGKLAEMGIAAFPDLVAASDDKRFSYSAINAAWCNYSVGDACFRIMESQVDFYGYGYKSRDGVAGRKASKPHYLWQTRRNGGLKKWWEQHQTRSLLELQIESVKWTIEQEKTLGFIDATQRREILDPLEARLEKLVATVPSP